jgi:hypothetical protein
MESEKGRKRGRWQSAGIQPTRAFFLNSADTDFGLSGSIIKTGSGSLKWERERDGGIGCVGCMRLSPFRNGGNKQLSFERLQGMRFS